MMSPPEHDVRENVKNCREMWKDGFENENKVQKEANEEKNVWRRDEKVTNEK